MPQSTPFRRAAVTGLVAALGVGCLGSSAWALAPHRSISAAALASHRPAPHSRPHPLPGHPPILTTAALPGGAEVDVPYTAPLAALFGRDGRTWSATGLPAGLSIDPATGTISGTPTASGVETVTVTVTDGRGRADSRDYALVVIPPVHEAIAAIGDAGTPGTVRRELSDTAGFLTALADANGGLPAVKSGLDAVQQSLAATVASGGAVDQLSSGVAGAQQYVAGAESQLDCSGLNAPACALLDDASGVLASVASGLTGVKDRLGGDAGTLTGLGSTVAGEVVSVAGMQADAAQADGTLDGVLADLAAATLDTAHQAAAAIGDPATPATVRFLVGRIDTGAGALADPSAGVGSVADGVDQVVAALDAEITAGGALDQLASGTSGAAQYISGAKAQLDCAGADAAACSLLDSATGTLTGGVGPGIASLQSQLTQSRAALAGLPAGAQTPTVASLQVAVAGTAGRLADVSALLAR